jgi:membrane fusion protein (multidrug efflux system)
MEGIGPAAIMSAVPRACIFDAMIPRSAMWALALCVLPLLPSCSAKKSGAMSGFKPPPVAVEVTEVRPQTVRDQFHALGTLEADEIVQVVSEVNAVVSRIYFAEGQPIARGALLAQLDDREIRAEAMRAEAQSEQGRAHHERAKKLMEQKVISTEESDNSRTALRVAEANEAVAKARLAKTRIRAPFSGLIGRRKVSPGAYLRAGDEIAELAKVDQMKVIFAAPERYLGQMTRGIAVEVTTPAYPDEVFAGNVSVIDPIVDPQTRTFQLVARIPNPSRKLRPGMSANASVTFSQRPGALVVPDEAVFAEGTQSFVYVVKPDSTVARTPILLGSRDSMNVEVLRGIEAGARVVRAGHQKLYEGARVIAVPDQSQNDADASGTQPSGRGTR